MATTIDAVARIASPLSYMERIAAESAAFARQGVFRWWTDPDVRHNADRLIGEHNMFVIDYVDAEEQPLTWCRGRCRRLPHPPHSGDARP